MTLEMPSDVKVTTFEDALHTAEASVFPFISTWQPETDETEKAEVKETEISKLVAEGFMAFRKMLY